MNILLAMKTLLRRGGRNDAIPLLNQAEQMAKHDHQYRIRFERYLNKPGGTIELRSLLSFFGEYDVTGATQPLDHRNLVNQIDTAHHLIFHRAFYLTRSKKVRTKDVLSIYNRTRNYSSYCVS